jgi:hypothetical protein
MLPFNTAVACQLIFIRHVFTELRVGAVASGVMFERWRRLDEYDRQRVWSKYGWFCGIMCFNCITGAVTCMAWALFLAAHHRSDFLKEGLSFGSSQYWDAISWYARVRPARFVNTSLFLFCLVCRCVFVTNSRDYAGWSCGAHSPPSRSPAT